MSGICGPSKTWLNKQNLLFNYPNFSSSTGIYLYGFDNGPAPLTPYIADNKVFLTEVEGGTGHAVYNVPTLFNRNFSLQCNLNAYGGSGADGFCIQWGNDTVDNGGGGGDVGYKTSSINAIKIQTYISYSNQINVYHNNSGIATVYASFSLRDNIYYWFDYNHNLSQMDMYYSITTPKPGSPQHTFTGFSFDANTYLFEISASTGGATDNHVINSMRLDWT